MLDFSQLIYTPAAKVPKSPYYFADKLYNFRDGAITHGVVITHVLHQNNDYLSNNPTTEKIETNKGIAVNSQGFLELKPGMREKKYTGAPYVRKS
jgi:hypothetical protein